MAKIVFSKYVDDGLAAKGWTPYRLAQELKGKVSEQTIYNVVQGKPCKSDTLAAILEALDYSIVKAIKEREARK
jgi:predicted transcriptional regulator